MTLLDAWLNFVLALAALVFLEELVVRAAQVVTAQAQDLAVAEPVLDVADQVEVDLEEADSAAAVAEDLEAVQAVVEAALAAVVPVAVVDPEVRAAAHVVRAKGNAEALLAGHQHSAIVEIVGAMASTVVLRSRSVIQD